MGARTRKIRHDDETRAKIQASQLINRLHSCAMGSVEMTAQQVSAAKTLLDKVLPDLRSIELEAEVVQRTVATKPLSPDEWAARHAGSGE